MRRLSIIILMAVLIIPSLAFAQTQPEQLTITTYYPSPFGSYRELRSMRMALGTDYMSAGSFAWGTQFSNDLDLVVRQKVAIVNSALAPTLNPTTWTLPALTVYGNVSADQFESSEGLGGYAYMTKGIGVDDFTVFFGGKRADTGNCIITHLDGNPLYLNSDATAGNVGIGSFAAAPTYKLQLSLDSAGKPGGGSWADSSDIRLKNNIRPINNALDKMLALKGITYQWKNPKEHGDMTGVYMGMIAQDVEKVFPEWVKTDINGYKTLGFIGFEALTTEAVRELKAENNELKAKNIELELRVKALETKLDISKE